MSKQITLGDEARQALLRGVNALSNVVKETLGPRGKNVVLEKKFGSPTSTKDGVTVAKEIELEEPFENMGAKMVKEVANKTNDLAGDGTTTASLLVEALDEDPVLKRTDIHSVSPPLCWKCADRGRDPCLDDRCVGLGC